MTGPCPREADVIACLDYRCSKPTIDELLAHFELCETCRDVAMLARLIKDDHEYAQQEIRVPAAGQIWWRAAVRARLEAVHAAARPLTWLNGVAAACAIGLVLALVGRTWPLIRETAEWVVTASLVDVAFREAATQIGAQLQRSIAFVLIAGAFVLIAPLAIYFALADN